MNTRILLADDHALIRTGLRGLIDDQSDMEVVAEAANGVDAVKMAAELGPDVVVMDVGMPDLNGVEATRQILAADPGIRVIALSMHSDSRFVERMLAAGASGYVLKDCAFEELSQAIRQALGGGTFVTAGVQAPAKPGGRAKPEGDLTAREREVLQLLAEGQSTTAIGERLAISAKTVETHRQNIKRKLNLASLAELTKFAIREGLTSLDA